MEGEDTELDNSVLEAIKDPLTHLVRNAVDHGIEPPRTARAGKPAEGVLTLRAYHEGGQVAIEVTDDGGGIDPQQIACEGHRARPRPRRRSSPTMSRPRHPRPDLPARLLDRREVTNVSGRGVGMDVVKTNIEAHRRHRRHR